jgi:peroxiredoxin
LVPWISRKTCCGLTDNFVLLNQFTERKIKKQTRKLPFKVALDSDGSVAKAFGKIQLTPTTLVINKKGKIIKRYVGEPDWDAFHQLIQKSLAE